MRSSRTIGQILLLATALAPAAAFPLADVSFDFAAIHGNHGYGTFSGSDGSMQYYLTGAQSGTGVGVTISGWQARATDRNFRNRTNNLKDENGIGVDRAESGSQEGIDNVGKYDLVIFQFDQMVSLQEIGLGMIGADYDMTVLAHTGGGAPTLDNGTFRYQEGHRKSMTGLGWDLVGQYAENTSTDVAVNAGQIFSSFWAIGAYTSAIIDASRTYGSTDGNADYFTLRNLALNLAGGAVGVAEPPVVLLLGLGLLLIARRRSVVRRA